MAFNVFPGVLDMQALRFYGSYNVTVKGITIRNSPQCHLKFDNSIGVEVFNINISSPGDSLNTDGIHLQNSKDVLIHNTNLACGKIHWLYKGRMMWMYRNQIMAPTLISVSNFIVQEMIVYPYKLGAQMSTYTM